MRRELFQLVRVSGRLRWPVRTVEPFDSAKAAERFATAFAHDLHGRIAIEAVRLDKDGQRVIGRELVAEIG